MTIETIQPFEELQRMCREMNAPVFAKRHGHSGKYFFARRPSCTIEQVQEFFASITNCQRTVNEP